MALFYFGHCNILQIMFSLNFKFLFFNLSVNVMGFYKFFYFSVWQVTAATGHAVSTENSVVLLLVLLLVSLILCSFPSFYSSWDSNVFETCFCRLFLFLPLCVVILYFCSVVALHALAKIPQTPESSHVTSRAWQMWFEVQPAFFKLRLLYFSFR